MLLLTFEVGVAGVGGGCAGGVEARLPGMVLDALAAEARGFRFGVVLFWGVSVRGDWVDWCRDGWEEVRRGGVG